MSESPHTAPKPRVDAASAGGDDRKGARRGAIFIGFVLIAYLVYLVVTGQFAEFVEAMSTVQGSWIVVASICSIPSRRWVFATLSRSRPPARFSAT